MFMHETILNLEIARKSNPLILSSIRAIFQKSENAIKTITKRLIHLKDQRKEINFIIKELKSLKKDILESFKRSP